MRTQRDRAEEKARRLEAEIVEWKDAAMFVCAPVVYGGHLRPSKVREEVASLRRHLAVKREQYESRARVCDELHAELEAVRRERDEWKAKHDTLADVSRSCIATAERERDAARAEREALRRHYDEAGPEHNLLALLDLYDERRAAAESERDEALAERDALHVALELAEVDVALERSWCRICRTECRGVHRGRREHVHAAECVLNIRAHAAKAVKP